MNGRCLCGDPYCLWCGDGQALEADASNEAIEGFMDELLDKASGVFDIPSIIDRSVLRDLIIEILLTDGTLMEALNEAANASAADSEERWYIRTQWQKDDIVFVDVATSYQEATEMAGRFLDKGAYLVEIESYDREMQATLFSRDAEKDTYGVKAPQCDDEDWYTQDLRLYAENQP